MMERLGRRGYWLLMGVFFVAMLWAMHGTGLN